MTPLLAVPHLAMAVGLAFLIAPSGWLARLASPWLTGWDRPPDLALVQDHHGLALTLGLAIKETPFLILMTFAALGQVRADDQLRVARSLGYGPVCAWLKVVLPPVYPQIRLPVYAVLAYRPVGGRHGDRARADHAADARGAGAALVQRSRPRDALPGGRRRLPAARDRGRRRSACGAASRSRSRWLARPWLVGGGRGGSGRPARLAAWAGIAAAVRSGARQPAQPRGLVGRGPLALSRCLAGSSCRWKAGRASSTPWRSRPGPRSSVGLATRAARPRCWSRAASRTRAGAAIGPGRGALTLVYLPLLVPQIGFLFGVQLLLVRVGLDGTWLAVVWAHLLFVLPYVFLTLADPYRSLDPRYARSAPGARQAALGGLAAGQAGHAAAPGSGRLRGRLRGQRGAVRADPVRRRRPDRDLDHRGAEPRQRRQPAHRRRGRVHACDPAAPGLRAGARPAGLALPPPAGDAGSMAGGA